MHAVHKKLYWEICHFKGRQNTAKLKETGAKSKKSKKVRLKLTAGGQNNLVKSSMEFRASICNWLVIKTAAALKNDSSLLAFWLLGTCLRLLP